MTVVPDSCGEMRAIGEAAGWALVPTQPEDGWPLLPTESVDDLVAVAAELNVPGDAAYVDSRARLVRSARGGDDVPGRTAVMVLPAVVNPTNEGLVQVFATHPATVARVVSLDDLGAVAASLNVLDRRPGRMDVVYVDRWAAAVRSGRATA